MVKPRLLALARVCVILILLATLAQSGLPPVAADPSAAAPSAGAIFVENVGQFAGGARFQVRGRDHTLWLAEDALWLTLFDSSASGSALARGRGVHVRLSFPGANPHPRIEPFDRLQTRISFLTGSDRSSWRADVPAWGGVRYLELYPGIDLELVGEQGGLVPRLATRPGADLGAVRLRVEGAEAVAVDGDRLRLGSSAVEGAVIWPLLRAEGATPEARVLPLGVSSFEVTAPLAHVQRSQPATPWGTVRASDAGLLYSTFLGGSNEEHGEDIAVDGSGAAYVTGRTWSSDLPATPGAFDPSFNGNLDAFVARLNPAGSGLDYLTYLGGSGHDYGYGIAADDSGAAHLVGITQSSDMPTTPGAFDRTHNGNNDLFVAKLNPAGSGLDYATILGGGGEEESYDIAVDGGGAAYVAGYTTSANFPTTPGAFDRRNRSYVKSFVVKLNATGSALAYSTFLGGSLDDRATAIAVDGGGAAYVVGVTMSTDFPVTPGAFDTTFRENVLFVAKLNPAGSALAYATFLGGSEGNGERPRLAVDGSGAAYVVGDTPSSDFPTTPGAFDRTLDGINDAFVAKLNGSGSGLEYATFVGGSERDVGASVAVDENGVAYVTGYTESPDLPTTPDAFDTTFGGGGYDAFVAKLNASGSALTYATFLGDSSDDQGLGIAAGPSSTVYVTGSTGSYQFPTTAGAYDTVHNGFTDLFVTKLAMGGEPIYSISGHVTDARGRGIADVTVSTAEGYFTTTDASGAYTLIHLLPGRYTLTARREMYRFVPATRTVDLPPDATGQDFEGLQFRIYLPLAMRAN